MRTHELLIAPLFITSFALGSEAAEEPVPPKVGQQAREFRLKSLDGVEIGLIETLRQGPAVVVVLRGFPGYQCPLCSRQVGELIASAEDFAAKDARIILVYPGPADRLDERAREFLKDTKLPGNFVLVTDPDYSFTNAYGLRWHAALETAYPSTFVISKDNIVSFALVSRAHGGRAKTSDVFGALE
ncbi:MAG: redoxin domain-containing protein [Planctomycetales bacterium]|nr:redoxin domain-containing protein [Planctomycetales bacterium]